MNAVRPLPRLAPQGWCGLLLVSVCWPLNWMLPGVRTAYLFFPLWLGYILIVDALVCWRAGESLWTRSRRDFFLLFILSAPAWWLFEFINGRTGNWQYLGADGFTPLQNHVLSTLSFSIVMPAVFETAELVRTFQWVKSLPGWARIPDTPQMNRRWLVTGLLMLALTLLWPKMFYPLVWVSLVFILEPVNARLGRPHLFAMVAARRLAARDFALAGRVDLRLFLGNVETPTPC